MLRSSSSGIANITSNDGAVAGWPNGQKKLIGHDLAVHPDLSDVAGPENNDVSPFFGNLCGKNSAGDYLSELVVRNEKLDRLFCVNEHQEILVIGDGGRRCGSPQILDREGEL